MPTGTGKTVCLLSLITSYQMAHPNTGKLVYCTRTVPEMNSAMEELSIVLDYRAKQLVLEQEQQRHCHAGAGAVLSEGAAAGSPGRGHERDNSAGEAAARGASQLASERELERDQRTAAGAVLLEGAAVVSLGGDQERDNGAGDASTTHGASQLASHQEPQRRHHSAAGAVSSEGAAAASPGRDRERDNTNSEAAASVAASPGRRKRKRVYGPKNSGSDDERARDGRLGPSSSRDGAGGSGALAICLSSRRNLCVNERVLRESDRETVDAACRSLTAQWARERAQRGREDAHEDADEPQPSSRFGGACRYFEGFEAAGEATSMPSGVYDLEELKKWAAAKDWCPYYLARRAINHASVLVFNYQYMLDPKVARMVSKELEAESIIVFDEAHNIDSVCIEAFSVTLQARHLEQATRSLGRLSSEINKVKRSDGARLQAEYQNLVNGLRDQGLLESDVTDDPGVVGLADSVLSPDVINEAVPGNIRRAEHFVAFLKKAVAHIKTRLPTATGPMAGVTSETPASFLRRMIATGSLEAKPLRFAHSRLASLLRTLRVPDLDEFRALTNVADFASLVANHAEGMPRFAIIAEPEVGVSKEPGIQLACLDASLAIAPLFKRFGSVVITSGTLSPLDLYPKLLQFEPCILESFNMSTFRPCIRPLVITRGSDQTPLSTSYQSRGEAGIVRNYGEFSFQGLSSFYCIVPQPFISTFLLHFLGTMLVELCGSIPDGVVAFFTSYAYMESTLSEWDGMGIMTQLTQKKLVFIETKDVVETTLALENFRRACDSGRGAIFLSVARGKVSKCKTVLGTKQ